jgi:hypothetical protein
MLKKEKSITLIILLAFLLVSPEFIVMANTRVESLMLSVREKKTSENVTTFGKTFKVDEFLRVEEWTNGTKLCVSVFVDLNNEEYPFLWVNCTKWNSKQTVQSTKTKIYTPTLPSVLGGDFPGKYIYDGWIYFLPKGNNGTHYVSYDHNDNYDGGPDRDQAYHPGRWYDRFNMTGRDLIHVHYTPDFLTSWYNNLTDEADAVAYWATVATGIGWAEAAIVSLLCAPVGAAIGIITAIVAIYEAIEAEQYRGKAKWIRDVITEQFTGDGWTWTSKPQKRYVLTYWEPFESRPMRVDIIWDTRNWYQSWGSEGSDPRFDGAEFDAAWPYYISCRGVSAVYAPWSNNERDYRYPP